jgi:hypothetical protein
MAMKYVRIGMIMTLTVMALSYCAQVGSANDQKSRTVEIFNENSVYYSLDDSTKYNTDSVKSSDHGRVMTRIIELPIVAPPVRIMAHLDLIPIPKDDTSMYDRWDRAGNIRLAIPKGADLEIIKFVTSYGGTTSYDVDLSDLAPLLCGKCTIKGFIDTWVNPAWKISLTLTYTPDSTVHNPIWAKGVYYEESFTRDKPGNAGAKVTVDIPTGLHRVLLHYYVSGHCTDGTDADEFVQKDNVIYVDGQVVYRFRPWRDDCRELRAVNPYCRRWSDGSWSCDYSRSGWCPGDIVKPLELDLTDHLTPGKHTIRFVVENVRPKDAKGNYGYWRLSSQVLGWK